MPSTPHTPKTNKITINLLKPISQRINDFLKEPQSDNLLRVEIQNAGTLLYEKSRSPTPDWINRFFLNDPGIDTNHFHSSSSKAALNVKFQDEKDNTRFFAICFGTGRFLFNDYAIEERFGLVTTLNSIDETKIRSLDKKTLSTNPKIAREQISKATISADFDLDYERDLLQSITGTSLNSDFGKTITGRASLCLSTKVDITNIKEKLEQIWGTYQCDSYKTNFEWVDQIQEIKDSTQIEELNNRLLETIRSSSEDVWLSVPEIIDWEAFAGYKYSKRSGDEIQNELTIQRMVEVLEIDESTTLDCFISNHISIWGEDDRGLINSWTILKCLNSEIEIDNLVFVLSDGKWYRIIKSYCDYVNQVVDGIPSSGLGFLKFNHKNEAHYNSDLADTFNAANLDHQEIPYGHGHSRFEFCDVFTRNKQLIHVKIYRGSAGLSHLFNQGTHSAELLVRERNFRIKVRSKLLRSNNPRGDYSGFRDLVTDNQRMNASGYSVIYAIIQNGTGRPRLPFFSRIALKNAVEVLRPYNFEIYLDRIEYA